MKKMGITHDLLRKGARADDVVRFGEDGAYQMTLEENS